MATVSVQIVRFVDDYQPGIVECQLLDAEGAVHFFIEKVPIVAAEDHPLGWFISRRRSHRMRNRSGVV